MDRRWGGVAVPRPVSLLLLHSLFFHVQACQQILLLTSQASFHCLDTESELIRLDDDTRTPLFVLSQLMAFNHRYVSPKDGNDGVIVFEKGDLVFVYNFRREKSFVNYRLGCIKPCKYKLASKSPDSAHEDVFWTDSRETVGNKASRTDDGKSKLRLLCDAGRLDEVMDVLEKGGISASKKLYAQLIWKCGQLKALAEARRLHSHLAARRLKLDDYLGGGLVGTYVSCGSLVDAERVHEMLPWQNAFSWTALMLGYVNSGQGREALRLYEEMQEKGVKPSSYTFVPALKACAILGDLETGKRIHSHLTDSEHHLDMFAANTLIDMYAKCGSMVDARHVFEKLPDRDVVSWTAVILGHVLNGECEVALQLYASMQQEGVVPNHRTFVCALKACSGLAALEERTEVDGESLKLRCLEKGRSIHCQIVKAGVESIAFVGNTLIDMYAKCGSMVEAHDVFVRFPHCGVVSWTAMILGLAQKEEGDRALQLYVLMLQSGIAPDDRAFVGALKACCNLATLEEGTEVDGKVVKLQCLEKGRSIHTQVLKAGFESDPFVGNTLIDMYAKCGSMVDAQRVFDGLPQRDVVSWTAMIWGYAQQSESEEAFKLYTQLQGQGTALNSVTFVSILKACGNAAALEMGKKIHSKIRRLGLETTDMMVGTSLVDMYGKCGSMVDAQQVFDALLTRDLVTWSALISGYARQGETEHVSLLLERMRLEGIQPNAVTFLSVLSVCSHRGLVEKGQEYFSAMTKSFGLTPSTEHYTCMVDLLARAGQMEEAVAMVEMMPCQPDLVTWMTLLSACRKWTNVEDARVAFHRAVRLDDKHAAAYVLMSNIFADARMWEDRDKIQAMRENAGAWKKPGQSWWTDSRGTVHRFVAGDTKHEQIQDISAKLKDLLAKMEEEGYVPDLDCVPWDISDDKKEDALCGHSEKLAIACALINTPVGTPIRIVKNLRACDDCHKAIALISKIERRHIICRDETRFHMYKDGKCTCGDYW